MPAARLLAGFSQGAAGMHTLPRGQTLGKFTVGLGIRTFLNHVLAETPGVASAMRRLKSDEARFRDVYRNGGWGSSETGSGRGSEVAATEAMRAWLPGIVRRHAVTSIVDVGCGDWNWMRLVDLAGIDYVGVDIVPDLIQANTATYARPGVRFAALDATTDPLPRADLVICRDFLPHLSFADIRAVLGNALRSGSRLLLATNSPGHETNTNRVTGAGWRHVNLCRAPFGLPRPLEAVKDNYEHIAFEISLWRFEDLPSLGR